MGMTVRTPAVAGTFYPSAARDLERQVRELMADSEPQHDLLGCVSPHAGYVYSGRVAGKVFSQLRIPRRVIVLGPNHTGLGPNVAVAAHHAWQTPLGAVEVDRDLAQRLLEEYPHAEPDDRAHWREHSVEVQLPFLQVLRSDLTVLPVCVKHQPLPTSRYCRCASSTCRCGAASSSARPSRGLSGRPPSRSGSSPPRT
jgi:AmmeMemoRadiSam system protein B